MQLRQGGVPHEQTADTGRISEHLVKRDRHEIGLHSGEIQPIGWDERRRIEQHVPAAGMRALDPVQRVLDAREVGLRRVREKVRTRWIRLIEQPGETIFVEPQIGQGERCVVDGGCAGLRELADAVDRVVIVEGEEQLSTLDEGVALTNVFQGAARVEREDGGVVAVGVEVVQDSLSCTLDQRRLLR
jgi:hypothetical protein